MDITNIAVIGIPIGIVITGLVEVIKRLFPSLKEDSVNSTRIIIGSAAGLGIALATGAWASQRFPAFAQWYEIVLGGALLGLASAGIWDFLQRK
jgi:hypothetical protein